MAKKLWGGRFSKSQDVDFENFSSSILYDIALAKYDCLGSIAHAKMLAKSKIISSKEASLIANGLTAILKEIVAGTFAFDPSFEDIHSNIQSALEKKVGQAALKLHTARSRNDQVALDVKLYLEDKVCQIIGFISKLQIAVLNFAENNKQIAIPGLTHLQHAQPVLLGHQMLAYVEMLGRDKSRLSDALKRLDEMPLGACALAGTSLKIDREYTKELLGFAKVSANSVDSVSDRDFIIETLSCIAILGMHLSRIAEDLIILSTKEFGFFGLPEEFCTGSSIMPQKKNPDLLELIRGTTGSLYGNLLSVLVMMKGLPLTYNRDMQLDKPSLFNSIDSALDELNLMSKFFKKLSVNEKAIKSSLDDEGFFATDFMEYLIKKGVSSATAHNISGEIVKYSEKNNMKIIDISLAKLKTFSKCIDKDFVKLFNVKNSIASKISYGSTSYKSLDSQIKKWRKALNARI